MKNPIGAIPVVDPLPSTPPRPAPAAAASTAAEQNLAAMLANARLVIEQDQDSGAYVYKTLDRITGEVLRQFPREEVLKMLDHRTYVAGDVIKTRA